MPQRSAAKTKVYAVITGDIVGSTKLGRSAMAKIRDTVRAAVHDIVNEFLVRNDTIIRGVEFFQGDSWQVVLGKPENALRLALLVQAHLRSQTNTTTRAAIGIGTVESLERTAGTSTGEAFTLSGRALETMTGQFHLTGALPNSTGPLALWLPGLLHLCSSLTRGWTHRQAEVMSLWLSLPSPTYDAIAARLNPPIAKQSISDILTSANLPALREVLELFATTNWQQIAGPEQGREV